MRVIGITPINNDVKEEKSMKFLQKLGKALMLPVAVLPICGILMGIGSVICCVQKLCRVEIFRVQLI